MSEMAYEGFPEVEVPRVRDWFSPLCQDINDAFWGSRGIFVVWGVFALFYIAWCGIKFMIWLPLLTALVVAYGFWAVAELITYRKRLERARVAAGTVYMMELHDGGRKESPSARVGPGGDARGARHAAGGGNRRNRGNGVTT
jgi:hypothetical protein